MSATQAILDFAGQDQILPAAARDDALRMLGDTLAGGAAGAMSPAAQAILPMVASWGAGGQSRALGQNVALPTPSAAFFNAFAIHCLEWDGVHEGAVVHAMSVVTGALLAASDAEGGSDPEAFLTALAVGVDIASGMGIAATEPMRFFRPATAGLMGAAMAVARLERLPPERFADVLGLAQSFASGTMQAHVEASIALPLQIANAARSAITAVDLVKAGMNGPHDMLEGPFGYSALVDPLDLARYTDDLGRIWRISEVAIKPFPSGRASHGGLGALAQLREECGLSLDNVAKVELFAPPLIGRLVGRPYKHEMTAAYARLCFPILAPLMLRDGVIDPSLFVGDELHDPGLVALARNVIITLDGNPDGNAMTPQRIVVTLRSGEVIDHAIPATLGSIDNPMNPVQTAQKYDLCRRLANPGHDPRLFDDPLSYATDPS